MSLNEKLAAYFKARPEQWIDGRILAGVAGAYAWRSRCSDLRKTGMQIQNRMRRLSGADGSPYTVSEYRWVPTIADAADPAFVVNQDGQSSFI